MADTKAIAVFESVYRRTDQQIRDILATYEPGAEVDTINVLIGDGLNELVSGVAAAIRVDFRARITGSFLQEFDGITGSVELDIARGPAGPSLAPSSIVGDFPPTITSSRYGADEDLNGWDTLIERGDILVFAVSSAALFTRLLVALRIRRLEP